jgi:hypothetical protein
MLASTKDPQIEGKSGPYWTLGDISSHWTILLLSPSGFFPKPSEDSLKANWSINQHAELVYIVYALEGVVKRWQDLNEYITGLLTENFMDPIAYVDLLIDDETFSRSRRYFWITGCLNEFDTSIADNIKQWELFRQARITPLLGANLRDVLSKMKTAELQQFEDLDKEASDLCETLENLRSQFKDKLMMVQGLRDGVRVS